MTRNATPRAIRDAFSALLALSLAAAVPAAAQKTAKEAEQSKDDPAKYAAAFDVKREHEILAQLAGSWQATLKGTIAGNPPKEVTFTSAIDIQWILGDTHLRSETRLTLPGGTSTTLSLMGYDPALKQYFRFSATEGDPRPISSTGVYDAATKTFTFRGPERDPVTGDTYDKKEVFKVTPEGLAFELRFVFQDGSEILVASGTFKEVAGPRLRRPGTGRRASVP